MVGLRAGTGTEPRAFGRGGEAVTDRQSEQFRRRANLGFATGLPRGSIQRQHVFIVNGRRAGKVGRSPGAGRRCRCTLPYRGRAWFCASSARDQFALLCLRILPSRGWNRNATARGPRTVHNLLSPTFTGSAPGPVTISRSRTSNSATHANAALPRDHQPMQGRASPPAAAEQSPVTRHQERGQPRRRRRHRQPVDEQVRNEGGPHPRAAVTLQPEYAGKAAARHYGFGRNEIAPRAPWLTTCPPPSRQRAAERRKRTARGYGAARRSASRATRSRQTRHRRNQPPSTWRARSG